MSKNIVVQLNVKPEQDNVNYSGGTFLYVEEMYAQSELLAKKYAKKCGAEYYKINKSDSWKPGVGKELAYQKLKVYDLLEYDNIFLIDSDFFIKSNAPSIFHKYNNVFSACRDFTTLAKPLAKNINIPYKNYFNSGMILFTKEVLLKTKSAILENIHYEWEYCDQGLLNKVFYENGIYFNELKSKLWNPADAGFGIYADHFAGENKKLWNRERY